MLHAWAGCVRWKADETARLGPLLARLGPLLGRLAPRLARLGPLLSRPVLWSTVVHCAAESLSQPLRGQLGRSALSRSVSLCEVSSDAVRRTAFASLRPLLARALMRAWAGRVHSNPRATRTVRARKQSLPVLCLARARLCRQKALAARAQKAKETEAAAKAEEARRAAMKLPGGKEPARRGAGKAAEPGDRKGPEAGADGSKSEKPPAASARGGGGRDKKEGRSGHGTGAGDECPGGGVRRDEAAAAAEVRRASSPRHTRTRKRAHARRDESGGWRVRGSHGPRFSALSGPALLGRRSRRGAACAHTRAHSRRGPALAPSVPLHLLARTA